MERFVIRLYHDCGNFEAYTVFELYAWIVRSTAHGMEVAFFFAFVLPLSLYFRRIFLEAEYVNVR